LLEPVVRRRALNQCTEPSREEVFVRQEIPGTVVAVETHRAWARQRQRRLPGRLPAEPASAGARRYREFAPLPR
jgi:hypothetical protein